MVVAMTEIESTPRPAATVVLLRDSAEGPTVLLLRRRSELAVFGGAWVFPGGGIDAADRATGAGAPQDQALCARRAAVRELREEAGIELAPEVLVHFSQWVTPPGRFRRFDTFFFAAPAPGEHMPVRIDGGEIDAFRWLTPRAALDARAKREMELPPPTFVTLSVLADAPTAASALASLARRAVQHFVPRTCQHGAALVFLYPGDAGYETCDPLAPGARHRLSLRDQEFHYEACPPAPALLGSDRPR